MPNIITSITVQKKNRNRFNLFINEQYTFSLNRQQAEDLHKGDHLSESKIAELKQADEKDFVKATHRVYRSKDHATHIKINVLPTGR
jgi:regulatory protein